VEHGYYIYEEIENDFNIDSPLISAWENGNEIILKYLVDHGAYEISENLDDMDLPFYYACLNGNVNNVKYLVEHGAIFNNDSYQFLSIA